MVNLTATDALFLDAWEPVSDLPVWQWVQENIVLGSDSELKRMDFDLVPMHKFCFVKFAEARLRRFTMMVAAQSGKTSVNLGYAAWKVRNKPNDCIWYADNAQKAKTFYKLKILPWLENCSAVKGMIPKARDKKTNTLIQFDSMNLHILGAEAKGNRESVTAFEIWADEYRRWPKGAGTAIDNRFKTIREYKKFVFSTAGDENDELHNEWKSGSQHLFFWTCPHCQHKQTFRFGREATSLYPEARECGGFVWDTNEVTKPSENTYNFPELEKTVRYECENKDCKYRFKYSERFQLIKTLEPIQMNPLADEDNVSVHWWEAYMPWAECAWGKIAVKFIKATYAAKTGDFEPLKVFVTETLGEPWRVPVKAQFTRGKVLERCGDYSVGETWDVQRDLSGRPSVCHVITADIQHGYLYYVMRQVRKLEFGGGSRLIDCGKMPWFDDLRAYQMAKKVDSGCVYLDCAYKPNEVYEACTAFGQWIDCSPLQHKSGRWWTGWRPVTGADNDYFNDVVNGIAIRRPWRDSNRDINIGKSGHARQIRVWEISKSHYRSRLFEYALPGLLPGWEIPQNIPNEYVEQMGHVTKRPKTNASGQVVDEEWHESGRHDFPDCEQFQLAAVDIGGWR